jgi:hypothetical protein
VAIEIVGARPGHVGTIANRMRPDDVLECSMVGMSPKQALRNGLLGSTIAWTAKVDGRPEAMFGAVPLSMVEGRGRVWMLGTPEVERHAKSLMRLAWVYTDALHDHFPILENFVPARNDRVLRWLSRLGFAIGPVDVYNGHAIRGFVRSRPTGRV